MSNTKKRLILFTTAVPIIFLGLIIPFQKQIFVHIIMIFLSVVGTYEMKLILEKKSGAPLGRRYAPVGAVLPLTNYLVIVGLLPEKSLGIVLVVLVTVIFIDPVFQKAPSFDLIITQIVNRLALIVYPSLFLLFIGRITLFENSLYIIPYLFFTVYLNDANAWFIGKNFGSKNSQISSVSPNKSLAGFLGGIVGSVSTSIIAWSLFPDQFGYSLPLMALIGVGISITTICGDLVESAIKRSAGVKDSGKIMLGRGGILDSIDSLLFSGILVYYIWL